MILKNYIKYKLLSNYQNSFSQEGEDLLLDRIFSFKRNGFYVDVGAHHPVRFSNTYLFYRKGWRGINIDGAPGCMKIFEDYRPNDINVESLISGTEKDFIFYIFNEPALNTLDQNVAREKSKIHGYRIEKEVLLKSQRLETLLERKLPKGQHIDFMSIDVEGVDLDVVRSNNWERFIPDVVLVESIGLNIENIKDDPIVTFLGSKGYRVFSKLYNTIILHHERFKPN